LTCDCTDAQFADPRKTAAKSLLAVLAVGPGTK
jgi:hypothetical protein